MARRSDGFEHTVTVSMCEELQATVVWKAIRCGGEHRVFTKWRQDRKLAYELV